MFSLLGKHVIVCTTNRMIRKQLENNLNDLHNNRRPLLDHVYRSAYKAAISFQDDANWKQQRGTCATLRKQALSAWQDFCDDCVIVVVLRYVLFGKPIYVSTKLPGYSKVEAAVGTTYNEITILPKLNAAMERIKAESANKETVKEKAVNVESVPAPE